MKDLCRVKRSCGGEGGKCSLAFLETRGISWRGHPKNLKLLHVVRCYPLRCMVNVQRIVWSRHSSMTAPGLPPHLCHEQGVNDHCKKQHRRLHKKNKMARRPLPWRRADGSAPRSAQSSYSSEYHLPLGGGSTT